MIFNPSTRRRKPQLQFSERKLLLALGDVGAVWIAVLISLFIWTRVAQIPFDLGFLWSQALWFVILSAIWLLLASANDFYDLRIAANRGRTLSRLLVIESQLLVFYVLIFFFSPRDALPRLFIFYYAILSFVLIFIWRISRPALLGWVSQPRRTLIIGMGASTEMFIDAIREFAPEEYEIRGIIGTNDQIGMRCRDVAVLGTGEDLLNFVTRDQITELVITGDHALTGTLFQAVMDMYERGVHLVPMTLLYEEITGRVPVEHVNNDWAIVFLPMQTNDGIFKPYPIVKRGADIFAALFGLFVFGLLLPVIALIIRLDSSGGVFYTQQRVGQNGRVFRIYKLRTMVNNAESHTGAVFAQREDPRITRVGKFMRKSRLDEIPQLLNVLRGDMSMVGPRPERPEHMQRLTQAIPFYRTRLIVRPGLTGWAQVRYEYGSTDEDALVKLQYDLYYVRHLSFLLDLNIVLRTVGKVISLSGV
jgi:exopolysaccharide biosynthesis polyprenyl glycosylphosphotransferase